MASSFSWLDYSEHERRKMLDVIELFGERTTRDELGFGSVRDAFADYLFPGTSTIQTRARYFLFVPWIYQLGEAKRWGSAVAVERLRKLEIRLIQALEKSESHTGVIGIRAKENVRRLASSVYWQGLGTFGIRQFPGSQDQYARALDSFYLRKSAHERTSREFEGESFRGVGLANWHLGLPTCPSDFPENASFALSATEADYLREQVLHRCPESLLAFFVRERNQLAETTFVWELDVSLPVKLDEWVQHGRNFSEVMWGAALLYNLMLAEVAGWDEQQELYHRALTEWWDLISNRLTNLRLWNRLRFWTLVGQQNPRVHARARKFIDDWSEAVLGTPRLELIVRGAKFRGLVQQREQWLKNSLSRFSNKRALELWQVGGGAAGADQMDLRWRPGQRFLRDLTSAWE